MNDKKYKSDDFTVPHMGNWLKNYLKKNHISGASLARKMQRSPVTISNYYKNRSIQMRIIWEISHTLKHNFFEEIAEMLPAEFSKKLPPENPELNILRTEIERLRIENELLKELLKR